MTLARMLGLALAACGALVPAACQESRVGPLARSSPAGIPVSIEAVEGPPPLVQTLLAGELKDAAASRQVELVGAGVQARYRVNGYLSTQATAEGGTSLAFVWDVFDETGRRRARRLTGASPAPGAGPGDPWEVLDKEALRRLAARSMEEIAGFLTAANTESPGDGNAVLN